jgi:hypothetical protein
VASGVLWGCALATKANALFLPGVVLVVVVVARVPERWSGGARARWLSLAGAAVAGPLTMVALWPWLWPDPISRYWRHLEYVSGQVFQVRAESLLSPTTALLGTTPPALLLLAAVGLVPLIAGARARRAEALLVLAWVAVVFGRLHLPGAVNFDGVRHFLELFPAVTIAAGLGGAWLVEQGVAKWSDRGRAHRSWLRPAAATVLTVLSVGSVLWSTVRTHPHQLAYWNLLVGGTRGAWDDRIPQAGDYWATSYREGLGWLREHAEPGAVLTVPIAQHTVDLVARERLRPDLGLAPVTVPNFPDLRPGAMEWLSALAAERPVYVMFVQRRDWMNELTRDCLDRLEPEAEWSLDGVALMRIYRFRPASDPE